MRVLMLVVILQFSWSCASATDQFIENEVSGVFFYGHETSAFVPCGTTQRWWADGSGNGMAALMEVYENSGVGLYGNLHVTLRGQFEEQVGNGDYVGIFHVSAFVAYSTAADKIVTCVPSIKELNK